MRKILPCRSWYAEIGSLQSRAGIAFAAELGGGAAEGGDGPLAELSEKHKRAGGNIREAAKGR